MTRNCLFFHIFKSGKIKFCTRPAIGMVHFLLCVKLRSAPLSSNPGTRSIRWQIAPESDRGACKTARPKDRVDKEERSNKHLLLDPMVVYTCIQIEKSYFLTIAGQTPLVCKLRVMSSALCQKSSLYWFYIGEGPSRGCVQRPARINGTQTLLSVTIEAFEGHSLWCGVCYSWFSLTPAVTVVGA